MKKLKQILCGKVNILLRGGGIASQCEKMPRTPIQRDDMHPFEYRSPYFRCMLPELRAINRCIENVCIASKK
jgi:hypothetical protein